MMHLPVLPRHPHQQQQQMTIQAMVGLQQRSPRRQQQQRVHARMWMRWTG
jgi:hypothetical protein